MGIEAGNAREGNGGGDNDGAGAACCHRVALWGWFLMHGQGRRWHWERLCLKCQLNILACRHDATNTMLQRNNFHSVQACHTQTKQQSTYKICDTIQMQNKVYFNVLFKKKIAESVGVSEKISKKK